MDQHQSTVKSVGQNIRALRLQSGWSLEVAANRLSISISALSKIENGITNVNLSRLEQIAKFYGVNLVQLWTLDLENSAPQAANLDIAKKKVSDLELEIVSFQRKVIVLYEKLRDQSMDFRAAHS